MATKNVKVTFLSMLVTNNGEWTGKGELYWNLEIDGEAVATRSINNALKVADGETITLDSKFRQVTKQTGQTLTVFGSVSEKDNLDKDENATFTDTYTEASNWGIGSTYKRALRDGHLDVTVTYKVESA